MSKGKEYVMRYLLVFAILGFTVVIGFVANAGEAESPQQQPERAQRQRQRQRGMSIDAVEELRPLQIEASNDVMLE